MRPSDRVQPSAEELERFLRSYSRRKLVALGAAVMWAAVLLVALVTGTAGRGLGEVVILVTWLAGAATVLAAWRCPRCGEPFGRRLRVSRCPHCYLEFEPE